MRPPAFWARPPAHPGWQSRLLAPVGALYARATAQRAGRAPRYKANVPVISVGNLNIGGTGKTPCVIALVEMMKALGLAPQVVTRGYGGRLAGPVRVDPNILGAADTGDEPLLIAAFCPVWVSRDRATGAQAAERDGADIILLDDAHQNPDLAKNQSLVIVDAEYGFGNGRVIPAGPLREPVAAGLARADAVVSIGNAPAQQVFAANWAGAISIPHVTARLEVLEMGIDWSDMRVFAFAGIGHPEKFFATLRDLGATLAGQVPLDDHQPLNDALLTRLSNDAARAGAQLVTTEKDAVRLPPRFRAEVLTLPVRLRFDDEAAIKSLVGLT